MPRTDDDATVPLQKTAGAPHADYGTASSADVDLPAHTTTMASSGSMGAGLTARHTTTFHGTTTSSDTARFPPSSPHLLPTKSATYSTKSTPKLVYNVMAVCLSWMALTLVWNHFNADNDTALFSAADLLLWPEDDSTGLSRQETRELAHWYDSSPRQIRAAQREADQARKDLFSSSSATTTTTSSSHDATHVDTTSHPEDSFEDSSSTTTTTQNQGHAARYLKKSEPHLVASHKLRHHHHHHHHHDDDDIPEGCETTVLILRHCEKGSIQEHCAYMGFERSVYLASLFGSDAASRWPLPVAIFAQAPIARHRHSKMNFREIETVGPLALRANRTVDDSYTDETLHYLGKNILKQARHLCGQVVVVSWKHSRIAHLARALGCGPAQGCPVDYSGKSYDAVWQVRLVYRQWSHSSQKRAFLVKQRAQQEQPSWQVFGSVQYEQFDPLAVSKQFGDYPPGGRKHGGNWEMLQVAYPERQKESDTAGWRMKQVGLPHTEPGAE